jgi:hypothetical protein
MTRNAGSVACMILVACLARTDPADAWAGNLQRPSISIPVVDGKSDPVGSRIYGVLAAHDKEFTGGFFINAHTELHYEGGTKTINALLAELAQIDGATLTVYFSKDVGATKWFSPVGMKDRPCDCSIQHLPGGGRSISMTIYLGGQGVDPAAPYASS